MTERLDTRLFYRPVYKAYIGRGVPGELRSIRRDVGLEVGDLLHRVVVNEVRLHG